MLVRGQSIRFVCDLEVGGATGEIHAYSLGGSGLKSISYEVSYNIDSTWVRLI